MASNGSDGMLNYPPHPRPPHHPHQHHPYGSPLAPHGGYAYPVVAAAAPHQPPPPHGYPSPAYVGAAGYAAVPPAPHGYSYPTSPPQAYHSGGGSSGVGSSGTLSSSGGGVDPFWGTPTADPAAYGYGQPSGYGSKNGSGTHPFAKQQQQPPQQSPQSAQRAKPPQQGTTAATTNTPMGPRPLSYRAPNPQQRIRSSSGGHPSPSPSPSSSASASASPSASSPAVSPSPVPPPSQVAPSTPPAFHNMAYPQASYRVPTNPSQLSFSDYLSSQFAPAQVLGMSGGAAPPQLHPQSSSEQMNSIGSSGGSGSGGPKALTPSNKKHLLKAQKELRMSKFANLAKLDQEAREERRKIRAQKIAEAARRVEEKKKQPTPTAAGEEAETGATNSNNNIATPQISKAELASSMRLGRKSTKQAEKEEEEERLKREIEERLKAKEAELLRQVEERLKREEEERLQKLEEELERKREERARQLAEEEEKLVRALEEKKRQKEAEELQMRNALEEQKRLREEIEERYKRELEEKKLELEMRKREEEERLAAEKLEREQKEKEKLKEIISDEAANLRIEEERFRREIEAKVREEMAQKEAMEQQLQEREENLLLQSMKKGKHVWEFSPDEIQLSREIGRGAYGAVYAGRLHGKPVAVKKMLTKDTGIDQETVEDFKREVAIMNKLRHPNLLLFMGACFEEESMMLVTEMMPRGSVEDLIYKKKFPLTFSQRIKIAKDCALGMNWLHRLRPPFLHLDLKLANLLVDENWNVKVADFGLSKMKTENDGGMVGSPFYMAPEMLLEKDYNEKADVYSFAIVLWELYTQTCPYEDMFESMEELIEAVAIDEERPYMPEDTPPTLRDLIEQCWDANPDNRPSFGEILDSFALDQIVIEDAIKDPKGRDFWMANFIENDVVSWQEFLDAMQSFFPDVPKEQWRIKGNPVLKALRKILGGKTGTVSMSAFGNSLTYFGPFAPSSYFPNIERLTSKPWFHGEILRDEAEARLGGKKSGTYLIRFSVTNPGCYTLSLLHKKEKLVHLRISRDAQGKYVYSTSAYRTLDELIAAQAKKLHLAYPCEGSPFPALYGGGRKKDPKKREGAYHDFFASTLS
ncbi:Serine/threonine-protein kinase edr1 [Balamuthia mandrillaris]